MNSSNMAIPVGLDLGSLNVRIALIDNEVPKIVNNADGDRFTLSLCKILEDDNQILIGESCKKWCDREKVSRESVSIRTYCGLSCSEDDEESEAATKAAVAFFQNMRQMVCDATNIDTSLSPTGYTLFPAIAIPDGDENDVLIEGIRKAISKGFCISPVVPKVGKGQRIQNKRLPSYTKFSLISNAAAVCVAHGLTGETPLCPTNDEDKAPSEWKRALVIDWGNSGLRVSVLKRASNVQSILEVVESKIDKSCSGDALVKLVMKHCASTFQMKHRLDVTESKKAMAKLRSASEDAIRTLCKISTAHIMIDGLYEGIDLNMPISRPRFEMLISNLMRKASETIKGIDNEDYDVVLRSGNMCSLPHVASLIDSLFPKAWTGNSRIAPEEAAALGSSINASFLLGKQLQTNKNSDYCHSAELCLSPIKLCLLIDDDDCQTIVNHNTPLPAVFKTTLSTKNKICVLQETNEGSKLEIAQIKSSNNNSEHVDLRIRLESDGQLKISLNGGKEVVIKV